MTGVLATIRLLFSKGKNEMRILQLTDIHLNDNKSSDENVRFDMIVRILSERRSAINFDRIIVTGDVSNVGSKGSYEFFYSMMDSLAIPYYSFPGNHDDPKLMSEVSSLAEHHRDLLQLSADKWSLTKIDTVVPGEDYGLISEDEISKFKDTLITNKETKIVVFMHHHPLKVGTPLVDSCMLQNSTEFLGLCKRYNVKLVAAGHAHTPCQQKIGQTLISIAPAVCYQWVNGTSAQEKLLESGFSILSLEDQIHSEVYFI